MKSKSVTPELFYAREIVEGRGCQYVRFSTKRARDYWISKDTVNRFSVAKNSPVIAQLATNGITWRHADGVSYAVSNA